MALIIAVEGGVQGIGHFGTDGIFNVRLGGALRGTCRFRFIQRLIRDLNADSGFIDDRRERREGKLTGNLTIYAIRVEHIAMKNTALKALS